MKLRQALGYTFNAAANSAKHAATAGSRKRTGKSRQEWSAWHKQLAKRVPEHKQWDLLFEDPEKWWDQRQCKEWATSPDFVHSTKYYKLYVNRKGGLPRDDVPDLYVRLEALDRGELNGQPMTRPTSEVAWRDLFERHWYYKDVRSSKWSERSPDFKHKETNNGLWLTSAPAWVWENLEALNEAFFGDKPRLSVQIGEPRETSEPAKRPEQPEQQDPEVELEWTPEQQETAVDALMSSLDLDLKEEVEPPKAVFSGALMRHQRQGLAWMLRREADPARPFGMLCDEQGLGKTAQAMALIACNPCPASSNCGAGENGASLPGGEQLRGDHEGSGGAAVPPLSLSSSMEPGEEAEFELPLPIRATLVVMPKGLLRQWHDALTNWTRLKVMLYADTVRERMADASEFCGYDVVLASYGSVLWDSALMVQEPRALFRVAWWRIILDEAQVIKSHRGKSVAAAVLLQVRAGGARWLMTGTPLQNSPHELYSYFHFLRYSPFETRKAFSTLFRDGDLARRVATLRAIVAAVMLRRTKRSTIEGVPIMKLPPRRIALNGVQFSEDEMAMYLDVQRQSCEQFEEAETPEQQRASVLKQLTQLRRLCDHHWLPKGYIEALAFSEGGATATQGVRSLLKADTGIDGDDCGPPHSAKLRVVMDLLRQYTGAEKVLVFSQWTDMLDLIEAAVACESWQYARLDGGMDAAARDAAVQRFKRDATVRIFLISLAAGKEGLNLAEATRVILVEPHFNPMNQEQAIDRAHRFGQSAPVHAHKLFVEDTIEERILELQQYKMRVSGAIIQETGAAGTAAEQTALGASYTLDDYKYLLGITPAPTLLRAAEAMHDQR